MLTKFDKILQRGYWIAGWLVCGFAILGFYLSVKSSENVSTTLERITNVMTVYATPFLRIKNYEWASLIKDGNISCNNPPIGIFFSYINTSNVPMQIHDKVFKIFYGDKELSDYVSTIGVKQGILAPGQERQFGSVDEENFQKYLRNSKNALTPPFTKVIMDIEYSRLNDSQCFHYHAVYQIGFDCTQPNLQHMIPLEERNSPIGQCKQ